MKLLLIIPLLLLAACSMHHDELAQHDAMQAAMQHAITVTSQETFLAEMIPHHQEAIDTSRLMLDSKDTQVRALAQSIIDAQAQEVDTMQSWLAQWYNESTYTPAYEPMMPDLTQLSGAKRDKAYLQGMIAHHEGAIAMAQQARTLELRPEVRKLVDNILRTQTEEIKQMNALLAR